MAVISTIPVEELDRQYVHTCNLLERDPGNWDAVQMQIVLEAEYIRIGRRPPTERAELVINRTDRTAA